MQWLKQNIFQLLEVYISQTQNQVILSEKLVYILRIQTYLLSLSYIFENQEISYLSVFTIFARPQIFLPNSDIYAYIILAFCLLWILQGAGFIKFKFILIFATLMKSAILNFYFEISTGQIKIITQIFIVLISFFQLIIQDGTNNINLINFDKISVKKFDYVIAFLNHFQMILYTYSQNQIYNDICTLLNIAFQIFQLCIYYPPFSNYQKSLFLTIQLYSIYLWLNIVSNFQKNALVEIIAFPFIYSIILTAFKNQFQLQLSIQSKKKNGYTVKFIIQNIKELKLIQNYEIQTPKSIEKKLIYANILLYKKQNYKAISLLKSLDKKQSLIQIIKIKCMIQQCLNQMANHLDRESLEGNSISKIAEWIIQSENYNKKVQEKLKGLIILKIECYNLLLLHKTNRNYDLLMTYIKQLISLQETLELWYEKYPSEKTQSILGFFYSEIMNDYFSAHELKSVAAISDEKMRRITINQDIFSNKMIYLLTQFDGKMKINLASNDSVGLLEFTNEELYEKNIEILIPPGIAEFHNELVLGWFETGISKYMKKINPNFLFSINQNYFTDVDFATDVSFSLDLKFIVFIQPQQTQQMILILDKKRKIKSFSKALLDNVGLKNQKSYIGRQIEQVLSGFPKTINQERFVDNAVACFQLTDESQDQSMFNQYNTQYHVSFRKSQEEIQYILVKFLFFKSVFQSQSQSSSSSIISSKTQMKDGYFEVNGCQYQIGNESHVEIPIDENTERKNRGLLEINVFSMDGVFSENSNYVNESKKELTNFQGQYKLSEELLVDQKFFSNHHPIPSKLSNFAISKNNNKSQKQKKDYTLNIPFHDQQSSYVSSMHGLKKSRFYKKYVIIQKIKLQESYTKNHKLFIAFLILSLLFHIIIQSLQVVQISQNFEKLVSDIDLIQIKNLIYQPFESFLLTRWTLNEINTLFSNQLMPETVYNELVKFPKLNLDLGFDQLNENLKQVLNRYEIQSFLEDTYTEIFVYTSTGVGEVYNISLRNSIQILLSYQYDFKMRYAIEGSIVSDSPYVYFSYRNYIAIKNQFTSLNEFVLQNTIIKSQQEADQLISLFVISLSEIALFLAVALHFFFVTKSKINKFFSLFRLVDQENIQQEIIRLKLLIQKINKDSYCLYSYKINIETKEKDLENQTFIHSQKRIILKVSNFKQFFFYYVFFIFLLLSTFGNAILTYITSNDYLDKYPFSVELYKQVSDVGTDVPTMYAQRQTLYRVSYIAPFLTSDYVQQIFQEVNNSLIRTQNFNLVQITFDNLLVSQSFKNFFSSIEIQNLCDFLPDFLKNRSQSLCPTVMDQSLQRGLITTLQYICNFILTDMQLSNFTNYTTYSYTDLEGAFLVSNIVAVINSRFHTDFLNLTAQFIEQITVHNIILLILCFCMILFSFIKIKDRLIFQLFLAQRLAYLLPIKAFIYTDSIERNLRFLLFEGLYST